MSKFAMSKVDAPYCMLSPIVARYLNLQCGDEMKRVLELKFWIFPHRMRTSVLCSLRHQGNDKDWDGFHCCPPVKCTKFWLRQSLSPKDGQSLSLEFDGCPIRSHNLLGQLLKLEKNIQFTVIGT